MDKRIEEVVEKYLSGTDQISNIEKLYGDASYRTYFRITTENKKTYVVMKMPEGLSSASEEITNYEDSSNELPYVNISNFLRSKDLPVPEICYKDDKNDVLILEDLGDRLLFDEVDKTESGNMVGWYIRAIDLLADLKRETKSGESLASKRSFDATLLNWEFDHFLEYGIEKRFDQKVDQKIKSEFERITRPITKEILDMEYLFTHRDYQSRNLIVKGDKIYLIDFQDALLGPSPYDLVALLRDSYVEIEEKSLTELIFYYCKLMGYDFEKFRREFDLITIQRKLKDAGRFVYIDRVKGNPNYLKYIPTSLGYVKSAIERTGDYQELLDLIRPYF